MFNSVSISIFHSCLRFVFQSNRAKSTIPSRKKKWKFGKSEETKKTSSSNHVHKYKFRIYIRMKEKFEWNNDSIYIYILKGEPDAWHRHANTLRNNWNIRTTWISKDEAYGKMLALVHCLQFDEQRLHIQQHSFDCISSSYSRIKSIHVLRTQAYTMHKYSQIGILDWKRCKMSYSASDNNASGGDRKGNGRA